jgi:hypothetical protein
MDTNLYSPLKPRSSRWVKIVIPIIITLLVINVALVAYLVFELRAQRVSTPMVIPFELVFNTSSLQNQRHERGVFGDERGNYNFVRAFRGTMTIAGIIAFASATGPLGPIAATLATGATTLGVIRTGAIKDVFAG